MPTAQRALPRATLLPALLLLTLLTAGCASDDSPGGPARKNSASRPPVPTLAGQETFFAGQILAEMKVGAMTGFKPEGEARGGEGEGKRRGHGGGGGFSMGGAGLGGGGRRHQGGGEAGPAVDSDGIDQQRQLAARRADHPNTPPVIIHLRFTNTSQVPVELVIADFLSPLGNFVVTPGKITLQPGQAVEVDPMASRLAGEPTEGEISLKLRLGAQQETKTITLKPEAGPTGPPPQP